MSISISTEGIISGLAGSGGSGGTVIITNFVPTTGSSLAPHQTIQFDILDSGTPAVQVVAIDFQSLKVKEIVHDGTSFGPLYTDSKNIVASISGGFHYTIIRDGGWPEAPYLYAFLA